MGIQIEMQFFLGTSPASHSLYFFVNTLTCNNPLARMAVDKSG